MRTHKKHTNEQLSVFWQLQKYKNTKNAKLQKYKNTKNAPGITPAYGKSPPGITTHAKVL